MFVHRAFAAAFLVVARKAAAAPGAGLPNELYLPAGTVIHVHPEEELTAGIVLEGEPLLFTVLHDVRVFPGRPVLIPRNSKITAAVVRSKRAGRPSSGTLAVAADVVFTDQERALILNWFRDHRSDLPPGPAKRDRLPPGLEKQLRERGTLPPGVQKRIHPLPPALEGQLRRLPAGYVRVVIGASVVLMNQETQVIHDIIRSAVQ